VATALTSQSLLSLKCLWEFFSFENVTPTHEGHCSVNPLTLLAISIDVSNLLAMIRIFSGLLFLANTNFFDIQAAVTVETPA